MKKILNNMLLLLLAASTMLTVSCKDDDDSAGQTTDREFMTMFITANTQGKGSSYPYNCGLDGAFPHGNTVHLYWFGVSDCAGYQVQMAYQAKVTGGSSAWASVQGTSDLVLDTIIRNPNVLDLRVYDLPYNTDFRCAIRALSPKDQNIKGDESTFAHASKWFGHGQGRQWAEYVGIHTLKRYATPTVIYVDESEITETTMNVYLRSNVSQVSDYLDITVGQGKDDYESFFENFNIAEDGTFGYQYLTVSPSPSNPNASVDPEWVNHKITAQEIQDGMIQITGLSPNSTYIIDVIDPDVKVAVDAKYNTLTKATDGKPGAPIILKYDSLMAIADSQPIPDDDEVKRTDVFALAKKYNAAPISAVLDEFITNTQYAQGQIFYLEGGKTYYLDGNDRTCKGFTLATLPSDVAQGKRARVISGIGQHPRYTQGTDGKQWQGPYSMFMFGRSPEPGEGGEIRMKKLAFYDIDFDNPEATNYGDQVAGNGTPTGNYFFNMYSDGMAVTLDSLVIENCTFKRLVRGFIREQGPNYKVWNHVLIKNNQFFDCGYYNQTAGGYAWIAGINQPGSNLYMDMKVVENTFYDSPFPAFFSETNQDFERDNGPWNITFSNNTLVNFNTRASGAIFTMRDLPDKSVYNVENNLFVLCKKDGDQRVLQMFGADIRGVQAKKSGDAGVVTLNFNNNWSTNNDLTNGQIFSGSPWTATSNNFGKLVKENTAVLNGTLEVSVASVSATELMVQPCPPTIANSASAQHMHRADALDGTASNFNVDLHIKHTDNEIVKNNVGAARWR